MTDIEVFQDHIKTRVFDSFDKAVMYCYDTQPLELKIEKARTPEGVKWVVQYISSENEEIKNEAY